MASKNVTFSPGSRDAPVPVQLDIGARLKWGEQGPCMCQKVEKLAKKVKGS